MDADVYGPNIPMMMGVNTPPPVVGDRIQPLDAHGVKLMSLGFLIERDQPAIWRGPIVMKIVTQFLRDVDWGTLDYLLVDMPPGTGDAQLSLVQATMVHGAVIVTTPQPVSTGDALRGAKMFERVNVPVLGIIENMSYLLCAHCGKPTPLFGSGGGRMLADELHIPLLGEIPLESAVREGGDTGSPIVLASPDVTGGARTQRDRDAHRRSCGGREDVRETVAPSSVVDTRPPDTNPAAALPMDPRDGMATAITGEYRSVTSLVSGSLTRTVAAVALPAVASTLLMTLFATVDAYLGGNAHRPAGTRGRVDVDLLGVDAHLVRGDGERRAHSGRRAPTWRATARRRRARGVGRALSLRRARDRARRRRDHRISMRSSASCTRRPKSPRSASSISAPTSSARRSSSASSRSTPPFARRAIRARRFCSCSDCVIAALALDPVLILGLGPAPRLGIAGAAVATIFTRSVAFLIGIVILVRRRMVAFGAPALATRARDRARRTADRGDRRGVQLHLRLPHAHHDAVRHARARGARRRASRGELVVHDRRRIRRRGGRDRRAESRREAGAIAPSARRGSRRRLR